MKSKIFNLGLITTLTIGAITGCGEIDKVSGSGLKKTVITADNTASVSNKSSNDKITLVWYPNESGETYIGAREEVAKLISEITGKEVEQKLTTDYAIAIEAVANGTAQIGCNFGAEGFCQAQKTSESVLPLVVPSGKSGTLDDAKYTSFFAVLTDNADQYKIDGDFSLDNIIHKKMSFVSNSSTSGFKIPTNTIINKYGSTSDWSGITVDDLTEGGDDMFFSDVIFGGSHQGSAYNLLSGNSDVAAFCDTELNPYVSLISGEESEIGAVYEIKEGCEAPFDAYAGASYTVINATPVLNGPWCYNADALSSDDVKAIQDYFLSDEVSNNPYLFGNSDDSKVVPIYKKSGDNKFVVADNAWYDPIRNMQ